MAEIGRTPHTVSNWSKPMLHIATKIDSIVSELRTECSEESDLDADGVLCIGPNRYWQPGLDRWRTTIYPPLGDSAISEVERTLGMGLQEVPRSALDPYVKKFDVPRSYVALLRVSNGLRLFYSWLNILGVRVGDPWRTRQPLELAQANFFERSPLLPRTVLIVAVYRDDQSQVCVDAVSGAVTRVARGANAPLNYWASLEVFLNSEISRIGPYFGPYGKPKDPSWTPAKGLRGKGGTH